MGERGGGGGRSVPVCVLMTLKRRGLAAHGRVARLKPTSTIISDLTAMSLTCALWWVTLHTKQSPQALKSKHWTLFKPKGRLPAPVCRMECLCTRHGTRHYVRKVPTHVSLLLWSESPLKGLVRVHNFLQTLLLQELGIYEECFEPYPLPFYTLFFYITENPISNKKPSISWGFG
jgi:hypothetical protein